MTSISRRTILGAVAALPAAAGPGRALAAPDALQALIDAHRAALAVWLATLTSQDSLHDDYDSSPAAKERYNAAEEVEWEARTALLTYRCRTFAEITGRADYLVEQEENRNMSLDPAQTDLLLASMRSRKAVPA